MSKSIKEAEVKKVVLRAYTLLKELKSKTAELNNLRDIISEFYASGDTVYISDRQSERVVLGSDFNRAIDSVVIGELAKSNPALKDELVNIAMKRVYDMTVGNFNSLLKDYPEIAAALYHKEVKPSLTIKPYKP